MSQDGKSADQGWPRCAASAAIFRGASVLLVQRGKGALRESWSLPGGHIEPGEAATAAALREVCEETGVQAELAGLVDVHDVILRQADGGLLAHYLIAVFCGRWLSGEPHPGSDEIAAKFVPVADLDVADRYRLTDGAAALIHRAEAQLQAAAGKPPQ